MKKIGYFLILVSIIVFTGCNQQKRQAGKFFKSGNDQLKMKNQINAISYFNRAIALDSTRVDFYMTRANTKFTISDFNGAFEDFTKVTVLDPGNAEAYLSCGVMKVYMKDFSNLAATDLNKAIQIDPSLTNAYYYLGVIKFVQKDLDAACINWHKAADMGSVQAIRKVKSYCN